MLKHVLVLTTTVVILASGVITATAQAPGAQTLSTEQSPTAQPKAEDSDQDGSFPYHPGMMGMGGGMMRPGMMGRGYAHHGWYRGRGMMGPMVMR